MAITRGNVTASSYGESFAEPAATNGDLLVANVTWFSGAATPSISGWTLVSGSVVHNGSGSNPVGCALFTKIKGSGSSGRTASAVESVTTSSSARRGAAFGRQIRSLRSPATATRATPTR